MNADGVAPDRVPERITGCAFTISNTLGVGFVGSVYENPLAHEMWKRGLVVVQQRGIVVQYDDTIVGEYTADLLVEDRIIVELKVVRSFNEQYVAQCRNYPRATGMELCH